MVIRRWSRVLFVLLAAAMLTGCMYRGEIERRQANPAFVREEIDRVAAAVERYYKARGVYPIKNADESTSAFEKYVIDLNRLVRTDMLSSIPANAFEAGGHYYYLLVHPETEPVVMLMDLSAVQQVADLQKDVDRYRDANGKLPAGAETAPGFFAIDYAALKREAPDIRSPFTNQILSVLLHASGETLIDYGLDIMEASRQAGDAPVAEGEDAREWLAKASPLAPALSYPYVWKNGEPVLTAPEGK
ncbi:hypothetical protein [Paenibacillus sp.]|uniref:hypothetical protein n=1 Tax=Paenibacillus sp. TaxID=58172 RepID=UPI0028116B55|nr:hypothetical protein [Paenibacillus sp.]